MTPEGARVADVPAMTVTWPKDAKRYRRALVSSARGRRFRSRMKAQIAAAASFIVWSLVNGSRLSIRSFSLIGLFVLVHIAAFLWALHRSGAGMVSWRLDDVGIRVETTGFPAVDMPWPAVIGWDRGEESLTVRLRRGLPARIYTVKAPLDAFDADRLRQVEELLERGIAACRPAEVQTEGAV